MMDIKEDLYLNEALRQRAFMLQYLKSNEELLNDKFNELYEISINSVFLIQSTLHILWLRL